jgi:colanic acid/amylovoran biosynthesis glycosyltransferase
VKKDHRVVFVSGSLKLGGATTFLLNLTVRLVRRRLPVFVVGLEHENPYAKDFEGLGIPLHVEDERSAIFEDRLYSALQVIRRFQPTAVISCLGPSSYEILRYVPTCVTRLGMMQADSPDIYPVFAAYVPFFDATVGVSRQIAANLRTHPVLGRLAAHYLPYGVPVPPMDGPSVRPDSRPIRILYLGRLVRPQKRVHLFPEVLRQLEAAGIPFWWTVAGDGPERPWLEKEMVSSAPDSVVEFAGAVSYRDVPALLDFHDVFLLASDHEGLPISLLEAMAHGLVPVVSNLPSGVSEVVDQECGILVDPENINGYAAGIIWLSQNPSALLAMATKARQRVHNDYSAEAMADRWLMVLDRLHKGEPEDWGRFAKITGPLNHDSAWFREPIRTLRRFARRCGLHP